MNAKEVSYAKDIIIYIISAEITLFSILISFKFFLYSFILQKFTYSSLHLFNKIKFFTSALYTITSITIGLLSIYHISDNWNINNALILYNFCVFVFLISFFIYQIRKNTQEPFNRNNYLKVIYKISPNDIESISYPTKEYDYEILTEIERSRLYTLRNYLCSYIINEDIINVNILVNEYVKHMFNMMDTLIGKNGLTCRTILNTIIFLYYRPLTIIKKTRTDSIYNIFLESFESIHKYCSVNKIEWDNYFDLNNFISDCSLAALKTVDEKIKRDVFFYLLEIQNHHLQNNCPKENEIELYYIINKLTFPSNDNLKDLQWEHVSRDYLRIIENVIDEIIKQKDSNIFNSYLYSIFNQINTVDKIINDGITKDIYFSNIISIIYSKMIQAISVNIFSNTAYIFLGRHSTYKIIVKSDRLYADIFIENMIDLHISLLEHSIMNTMVLDELFSSLINHEKIINENQINKIEYLFKCLDQNIDRVLKINKQEIISKFKNTIDEKEYLFNKVYDNKFSKLFLNFKQKLSSE